MQNQIFLASTSPYRRELLNRLRIPYQVQVPIIDEEKLKDPKLNGTELSRFLSFKKAEGLVGGETVVLGADQVVVFQNSIIGKPGTPEMAIAQLLKMQGQDHEIITSFCLINSSKKIEHTNITKMKMRALTETQIKNYVNIDKPLDCAGSYKIEKLGISLFEKIETDDFTAIQGLPLIALVRSLKEFGIEVP